MKELRNKKVVTRINKTENDILQRVKHILDQRTDSATIRAALKFINNLTIKE